MALDTLEHFLGRIEDASEEQYSSGPSENVDSRHVEEAVLVCPFHFHTLRARLTYRPSCSMST